MGAPERRQAKFARESFVPFLAISALVGFPVRIVKRYPRESIRGSTYVSLPGFVESVKVDARGTSTCAKAGFGLFTVRTHSHAMTVSCRPTYLLSSGRCLAIS